jgi:hypothetical protein
VNKDEKYKFYISRIKEIFGEKPTLNKSQVCRIIGISPTTFFNIIEKNDLHLLPKFKSKEKVTKNNKNYKNYSFEINDVAMFMAQD